MGDRVLECCVCLYVIIEGGVGAAYRLVGILRFLYCVLVVGPFVAKRETLRGGRVARKGGQGMRGPDKSPGGREIALG